MVRTVGAAIFRGVAELGSVYCRMDCFGRKFFWMVLAPYGIAYQQ